jgi:hypothetical protein
MPPLSVQGGNHPADQSDGLEERYVREGLEANRKGLYKLYLVRDPEGATSMFVLTPCERAQLQKSFGDTDHVMWARVTWDTEQNAWSLPTGTAVRWKEELMKFRKPTADELRQLNNRCMAPEQFRQLGAI